MATPCGVYLPTGGVWYMYRYDEPVGWLPYIQMRIQRHCCAFLFVDSSAVSRGTQTMFVRRRRASIARCSYSKPESASDTSHRTMPYLTAVWTVYRFWPTVARSHVYLFHHIPGAHQQKLCRRPLSKAHVSSWLCWPAVEVIRSTAALCCETFVPITISVCA